ncbi:P63C domain-containing protein [Leucobacter aridicollis]|uniref:P63C domain-containing protein n=1 Tax=Leucobacter aridicollis TaxID=283878 RepID=UPI0021675FC5|nr:P63C domain-containing protein [Leucobacter aridicollis]MCS3426769.1 hypothetical protein [Leucobacter aridicollis]
MNYPEGRAKGGVARAATLTPEQRSAAASKAATARWTAPQPLEVIAGSPDTPLVIGEARIECYVLEDGTRVISQAGMLGAVNRSRLGTKPSDDKSLPPILRHAALRPFIDDSLIELAEPIPFITPSGFRGNGYRANVLPRWCNAWTAARDAGALAPSQKATAQAADMLVRGLAEVGITALVDEATGYQDQRAKDALAKILEGFVADELQQWVSTFDVEWYKQMFRLRGLPFDPNSVKRPPYFGHLTNNTIYKRLAPGIFEEIKAQRERDASKKRAKMHQQLTRDIGHPKLKDHLTSVTTIMKLSEDWPDYIAKLDRIHPIVDPNMPPTLFDDEIDSGHGF